MALAVVQKKSVFGALVSSVTTGNISTTTGNLLEASVSFYSGNSFSSLTDSPVNNTFQQVLSEVNQAVPTNSQNGLRQYYAENITGDAAYNVTLTLSGNGYPSLGLIEVSGAAISSALDASGSGSETSTATTHAISTSGATVQNDEIVIACFGTDDVLSAGSTWTADAAFVDQNNIAYSPSTPSTGLNDETRIISSTGVQTCTVTTSDTVRVNKIISTYKAAGGATAFIPIIGRGPGMALAGHSGLVA